MAPAGRGDEARGAAPRPPIEVRIGTALPPGAPGPGAPAAPPPGPAVDGPPAAPDGHGAGGPTLFRGPPLHDGRAHARAAARPSDCFPLRRPARPVSSQQGVLSPAAAVLRDLRPPAAPEAPAPAAREASATSFHGASKPHGRRVAGGVALHEAGARVGPRGWSRDGPRGGAASPARGASRRGPRDASPGESPPPARGARDAGPAGAARAPPPPPSPGWEPRVAGDDPHRVLGTRPAPPAASSCASFPGSLPTEGSSALLCSEEVARGHAVAAEDLDRLVLEAAPEAGARGRPRGEGRGDAGGGAGPGPGGEPRGPLGSSRGAAGAAPPGTPGGAARRSRMRAPAVPHATVPTNADLGRRQYPNPRWRGLPADERRLSPAKSLSRAGQHDENCAEAAFASAEAARLGAGGGAGGRLTHDAEAALTRRLSVDWREDRRRALGLVPPDREAGGGLPGAVPRGPQFSSLGRVLGRDAWTRERRVKSLHNAVAFRDRSQLGPEEERWLGMLEESSREARGIREALDRQAREDAAGVAGAGPPGGAPGRGPGGAPGRDRSLTRVALGGYVPWDAENASTMGSKGPDFRELRLRREHRTTLTKGPRTAAMDALTPAEVLGKMEVIVREPGGAGAGLRPEDARMPCLEERVEYLGIERWRDAGLPAPRRELLPWTVKLETQRAREARAVAGDDFYWEEPAWKAKPAFEDSGKRHVLLQKGACTSGKSVGPFTWGGRLKVRR